VVHQRKGTIVRLPTLVNHTKLLSLPESFLTEHKHKIGARLHRWLRSGFIVKRWLH
jgi:hypothetical protein